MATCSLHHTFYLGTHTLFYILTSSLTADTRGVFDAFLKKRFPTSKPPRWLITLFSMRADTREGRFNSRFQNRGECWYEGALASVLGRFKQNNRITLCIYVGLVRSYMYACVYKVYICVFIYINGLFKYIYLLASLYITYFMNFYQL